MIVLELIFSITFFFVLCLGIIILSLSAIEGDKKSWIYVFMYLFFAIAFHGVLFNAWSLNFNYTYCEAKIIGRCTEQGERRKLEVQYTYKGEVCQRCFSTDNYSYEYLAKKQVFKVRVPAYSPITGARIEWE